MTRLQLRPFYSPEELTRVYARPYDHTRWPDHVQRVARTARVLDDLAGVVSARTVADLSCGDGAVVGQSRHPWEMAVLGDYATTGPLEKGLVTLDPVDVYVCSETLEHLEDPDAVLRQIRDRAAHLVLTTPVGESNDANPEHYWGWGVDDLLDMLCTAGWKPRDFELFVPQVAPAHRYYTFQIWTCS